MPEAAENVYRKAIDIREQLIADEYDTVAQKERLTFALRGLGQLLEGKGQVDESVDLSVKDD